jgi:alpha-ketoglutarate-dependent sulfate ester dioxygenase
MTDTDTVSHRDVRLQILPLAGRIGAELAGVDIGTDLRHETVVEIRDALLTHRVVFLRDQRLDYAGLVTFAQRFGPLTLGHPTLGSPAGQPHLEEVDSKKGGPANQWHTDVTFVDRPPAFTFLYGVVIPPVGGDTIWANTVAGYASLPAELRELADKLRIVHSNAYDYTTLRPGSRRKTRSCRPTGPNSCRRCSRLNIQPCGCTPKPGSDHSCSAGSPRRWRASGPRRRETSSGSSRNT